MATLRPVLECIVWQLCVPLMTTAVLVVVGQAAAQAPCRQTVPPPHTVPQVPQLFGSVCRLVQVSAWPVPHESGRAAPHWQVSLLHVEPPPQA